MGINIDIVIDRNEWLKLIKLFIGHRSIYYLL